ncbi:MAG TPA: bifunctional 4-hydroxy-2-oxoglutarate aldolase/2-dehydro-3-deoxy-phosphogluconate aldolase [Gemmatimonadaceae bacterium]|nr:bifunctional 4-hydroxy-2-oxoglutarate aldolase/2-dehydro-3-deoxy-phosphogluconate aldolase [Gemmatimonadaceae bacterium]
MTIKERTLATIREVGIIPVIRASDAGAALAVVEALAEAGLTIAEVTMTVPDAIPVIGQVAKRFGERVLVGAGTVTDAETARRSIDAGARFVVSPCLVREVIEAAARADVAVLPGALTPTEIFEARRLGGDLIKVFPAQNVGGASYLRALRGPFPDIPLVPTGGVTLDNIREMFDAGAAAVGVGGELISRDALARRDYPAIGALAVRFMAAARAKKP